MISTTSGYAGGSTPNPDYHHIGDHSETVLVEFDPRVISYAELLEVFWSSHDPISRTFSRQYRNAVFTVDEHQHAAAEQTRQGIAEKLGRSVNTAIEPAGRFTPAEDYHQKHVLRRAGVIFEEFRAHFADEETFTASTAAARLNGYLGCNGDPAHLEEEIGLLGLSPEMQTNLRDIIASSCGHRFGGLTCPAPP